MKCIFIDFVDQEMVPMFGYQIRAGYLFSSNLNVIGACSFLLIFYESYKKASFKEKIDIVKTSTENDATYIEHFEQYDNYIKSIRKMKHLPKDVLVSKIRYEKAFEKMLDEWANNNAELATVNGISDLFYLMIDGVFDTYDFNQQEHSSFYQNKMEVFKHQSPSNAKEQSVWSMSLSFFNEILLPQNCSVELETIKPNVPFLVKAFELPNINMLNYKELGSLKQQLHKRISNFLEIANNWAIDCYKGNATEIFINQLVPVFAETAQILSTNEILMHTSSAIFGEANHYIFFGAVSPVDIWNYYYKYDRITLEEKQELEEDYKNKQPYFVPIMLFSAHEDLYNNPTIATEEELVEETKDIVSVKKHISLDEE